MLAVRAGGGVLCRARRDTRGERGYDGVWGAEGVSSVALGRAYSSGASWTLTVVDWVLLPAVLSAVKRTGWLPGELNEVV